VQSRCRDGDVLSDGTVRIKTEDVERAGPTLPPLTCQDTWVVARTAGLLHPGHCRVRRVCRRYTRDLDLIESN
jgi:hypothetical protein